MLKVLCLLNASICHNSLYFVWDFLKVRHAVTGMLGQKYGIQLTVSLIPLQKIKELQKVLFN